MMTTYNHERYIAQAVQSVVEQETSFPYELVAGEDCSTDNTRDILAEWQLRYPDKIRLLLRETNWGRRPNFIDTFRACQGEYIAILEGDDYWTSNHKLQCQVDFLDSHPDCTICFHPVMKYYEDDNGRMKLVEPSPVKEIYTIHDLLARNMIDTCSVMFRNRLFDTFPQWFHDVPSGDWPLYILTAQYGNIGYIHKAMSVYRIHSGGVWSPYSVLNRLNKKLAILEAVRADLLPQYQESLEFGLATLHLKIVYVKLRERQRLAAMQYILSLLKQRQVPLKSLGKVGIYNLFAKKGNDYVG